MIFSLFVSVPRDGIAVMGKLVDHRISQVCRIATEQDSEGKEYRNSCTGTYINGGRILTAAHCYDAEGLSQGKVRIRCEGSTPVGKATNWIPHPHWNGTSANGDVESFVHDVGIYEVKGLDDALTGIAVP